MSSSEQPRSASPEAPTTRWGIWIAAARPKTLGAAIGPVLLGTAMAWEAGAFHPLAATCALLGAIFIQIGTNFSNDYVDYLKGADTEDRKGPLRVTQAGLVDPLTMRRATVIVFGLAMAAGGYLIWRGGWPILLVGLLSIASGILYTAGRYSLAYTGLADLFVLVFFGPVAVGGTYYVQALTLPGSVLIAGLGPGLLAVAILLVNNIRDVEEDRAAGKRTLIARTSRRVGVVLYSGCVAGALVVAAVLAIRSGHLGALATVVVAPLAVPVARTLAREQNAVALNPLLGATGRLLLLYSVVFAIGWNV
jgi:1,4-dihydroxy-2-naphthoate octaprenyltransferase